MKFHSNTPVEVPLGTKKIDVSTYLDRSRAYGHTQYEGFDGKPDKNGTLHVEVILGTGAIQMPENETDTTANRNRQAGTRRDPEGDDRERRDDHADQLFQVIAGIANNLSSTLGLFASQLVGREQEEYDRRVRQENELFSDRRDGYNHDVDLQRRTKSRTFETAEPGSAAKALMAKELGDAAADPDTPDVTDSEGANQNAGEPETAPSQTDAAIKAREGDDDSSK
jgi:hypothetical protein